MASSTNRKMRNIKSMWIKTIRNNTSDYGHRHMASQTKHRSRKQKSKLKNLANVQNAQVLQIYTRTKCKRSHTFEDSFSDPQIFRAPHRRVLH